MKRFLVMLAILGMIIASLSSCGLLILGSILDEEDGEDETNKTTPYITEAITEGETEKNIKEEPTKEEKKDTYHIGETATLTGLEITMENMGDWESDNMFIYPAEGYKFIRVYFTIKNTSKTDKTIGTYDFKCYADGALCDDCYYGDERLTSVDSISSGRIAKGYLYFEVPENANSIEIEYDVNIFTSRKIIFVAQE